MSRKKGEGKITDLSYISVVCVCVVLSSIDVLFVIATFFCATSRPLSWPTHRIGGRHRLQHLMAFRSGDFGVLFSRLFIRFVS